MGRERHWSRAMAATRGEGKESLGCMSGMLNFLDFHQLLFTTTSTDCSKAAAEAKSSSPPRHHRPPPELFKGVEAPRNSLELDEGTTIATSALRDEYYDIPVGIQLSSVPSAIVAKKKALSPLEEERRSTDQVGTPRTPNLVARLMGLDVLPDQASSPVIHCQRSRSCSAPTTPPSLEMHEHSRKKKKKKNIVKRKQCVDEPKKESSLPRRPLQNRNSNLPPPPHAIFETGFRSLPDTPRASWDVDPRLSLQLNKENMTPWAPRELANSLDVEPKKEDRLKGPREENKSPKNNSHASDIVKQLKDNIISNRKGSTSGGSSEHWAKSKRTRPAGKLATTDGEPCNQFPKPTVTKAPALCSTPSTQLLEPPPPPKPSRPKPSPSPPPSLTRHAEANARLEKFKKPSYERFTERIRQQSQPSASRRPEISLARSSPTQSQIPQKQTLSSFLTITRKESTASPCPAEGAMKPSNAQKNQPKEREPEFQYVRSILVHSGIIRRGLLTFRSCPPSRLIDPVIFHKLELKEEDKPIGLLGPLRHRWNRKLLFHLVQEILLDLPERLRGVVDGEWLLLRLWAAVRSFPEADCRVAGDIDALVEADLPAGNVRRLLRHPAVAEEAERVATEIEGDIVDSLLGETVASLTLLRGWVVT